MNASDGEVKEACKLAAADEFIDKLPNPINDVYASASYRRRMIAVLLADQILFLAGRK